MVCDSDAIFKVFPGAVLDTLVAFWDPFWRHFDDFLCDLGYSENRVPTLAGAF